MKSMPLIATVTLAIAAIFLGESFRTAESNCFWGSAKSKRKKPTETIQPVEQYCEECGIYPEGYDQSLSMALLYHKDIKYRMAYAAVIGKRLAVSVIPRYWVDSTDKDKYEVYFIENNTGKQYHVDRKTFWTIREILFGDENLHGSSNYRIIMVEFDKDIPEHVVPTCLPKDLTIIHGQYVNVARYNVNPDISEKPFCQIMSSKEYHTHVPITSSSKTFRLDSYDGMTHVALGAPVTYKIQKRRILIGLMKTFTNDETIVKVVYMMNFNRSKMLEWIAEKAKELQQNFCPMPKN